MAKADLDNRRTGDRRGDWRVSTRQSDHIERPERTRRGGGGYDAGPGDESLPKAADMDRPPSECGTLVRTGSARQSVARGIEQIQDQDPRGGGGRRGGRG